MSIGRRFTDSLAQKIANAKDPCPKCGYPLKVMMREEFIKDGIIVRHICPLCGLGFNPDGSTFPVVSSVEATAQLEVWKAEQKIADEAVVDVLKEAAKIFDEGECHEQ